MSIEQNYDASFASRLALREKQIQQSYRPTIGIHKWFARRPGSIFRSLLLAEYNSAPPLEASYFRAHSLSGTIADPFMGGGTPLIEANRLGFNVVGADVNPMAYWIVRQSLGSLDLRAFRRAAAGVVDSVASLLSPLYETRCNGCSQSVPVKYFLWVKLARCPHCTAETALYPRHLLAQDERHPFHVVVCATCGALNEYSRLPTSADPAACHRCNSNVCNEGNVTRQIAACQHCKHTFKFISTNHSAPFAHRLWAIEYHCPTCKAGHQGRFFKAPDAADLELVRRAEQLLGTSRDLPIPDAVIIDGDESRRLHRWGYRRYRELFNSRQLFGLGTLLKAIMGVPLGDVRHALLTVFSDCLRYQNMLCRYDTYALKCQDIFSVHGFPVALVQCENNLLGIPRVGSGSFLHFIEKYARAKEYCQQPFETFHVGSRKHIVPIAGETIEAEFDAEHSGVQRSARLVASPAATLLLKRQSLDGVFTDPPYFDNVQYAELIDFCFVWLRLALRGEFSEFAPITTRSPAELTGNETLGRDLTHFTKGLSEIFRNYAVALKPRAPFVFTYHHNEPAAYMPLVVALLDAKLNCTAVLPAVAEMNASLHIAGSDSSVLDSIFVCRDVASKELPFAKTTAATFRRTLYSDASAMSAAGLSVTAGDLRCLAAGHVARVAINKLRLTWNDSRNLSLRMAKARQTLQFLTTEMDTKRAITAVLTRVKSVGSVESKNVKAV